MSTETLDGDAVREFAPGGGLDGISITRRRFRLDRRQASQRSASWS